MSAARAGAVLCAALTLLPAPRADGARPAAVTPHPRFAAGPSFALAQIAGGSRQRDEAIALGLTGGWRPLANLSLLARYARATLDQDYGQLRFHSAYHRLTLAPEARLPLGPRFDFLALAGPELVLLRSALWDREGGTRERSRWYLALTAGAGAAYRIARVELRADVVVTARDRRTDLGTFASALYTWR